MLRRLRSIIAICLIPALGHADEHQAAQLAKTPAIGIHPTAEQTEFFELQVRPLLAEHCYECHSKKSEKLQAGLRVDARTAMITGGDSGAAIVPGKPDESLLIDAVRWKSYEMPPSGKLSATQIDTLAKWVEMGAPWPGDAPSAMNADHKHTYDMNKWRHEHWAFRPVTKSPPPAVMDEKWPLSDVDRFVLAQLEANGLHPAPSAEPGVLVRRLYFDLIGIPPTSEQVDLFIAACQHDRQQAIRNLVDRLLQSSQYGERWGRHWLDVARYSDGYGGFLDSDKFSEAWRYRDWVVRAFNDDMPFDQFVRLQIAGDLIGDASDAIATGFFALGPTYRSDGGDPDSIAQAEAETLSDRLDTLGRGILGLTLACARCHDHKFDPLPQQDYYSLAGVFKNTNSHERPLVDQAIVDAFKERQQAIATTDQQIQDLQTRVKNESREATSDESMQLKAWQTELDELRKTAPAKYDFAHALHDTGSADMHVAIRGNLRKPGDMAPRRFLQVLSPEQTELFNAGSGRRQLADAVTDAANPLTVRVFLNRVWGHHFGQALVRTPGNFGALGDAPTHPKLLDWLTATFFESGQSVKSLHRTILLSATYQMSSQFDERAFAVDGDNRLLWRMSPRRLDVEAWRDTLLSVTGELDPTQGGPPVDRINSPRRTLYFKVSRNGDIFPTDEFLRRFDFPLMRATIDQRPDSIVPQQFLFLMNSQFMQDRARVFTSRMAVAEQTDDARIRQAYTILYNRPATNDEVNIGLSFLIESDQNTTGLTAWQQYAQVLLSANEFMYLK